MKSLFIRCSEETYELAHALAKKENRSLNKQIIHMIHNEADDKGVVVERKKSRECTN
jgi:predicted HicB family RNase H-like nuclease